MNANVDAPVALITGAAQRIGAQLTRALHQRGYRVLIHCRHSTAAAAHLAAELTALRADSAAVLQAALEDTAAVTALAAAAVARWDRLDVLINNASSYYPTAWGDATPGDWDTLIGGNLKGAFFLTQALLPALSARRGCVINLIDIFAERPLPDHPIYCIAKAGLAMMTKSLARDLGGSSRVNGIAPGAILWPEPPLPALEQERMLERIPSGRIGEPADIARTALFLIEEAPYINGQIIAVDGGLSLA
jgi:pteridine reductase